MLLTSLEIYGFKSFADRTKFVFDQGITGVVGPNGCGKSNIVDSIRWVLGEQRTRNLRSDKMENVIFNGTSSRRRANFAEVSLSFENTKNILPTEYTTVTITRKLYRTGESEYLINGVQCRLKDIQELFMDTGIASDSYAIIELKMVDEILTNKDQERRRFFEEASGISKYKIRKKQTLRKLEDTDNDLTRVEDLLAEIEKNLKNLEKQAKRTQKYFELKEQYKLVSSQYAYLKLETVKGQQEDMQKQEQELSDEITEVQTAISLKESRLQELKKLLLDHEQGLSLSQQNLNKHIQHLQSVESEKNVKNERLKYLHQRQIALNNQIETERKALEKNTQEVEELKIQAGAAELDWKQQQGIEKSLSEQVAQLKVSNDSQQQLVKTLETEHKETETEQRNLIREKDIMQVRLKSLESELLRAEEDRNAREGDLDEFSEKGESLREEVEALKSAVEALTAKKAQHQEDLQQTEQRLTATKDEVYKTNRMLDAKTNEYNLTKSLVESLEGFPESVKFLKKNASWMKEAPLLSDIFISQDAYKIAIEQYLDPYLSYYVVNHRSDALASIDLLAKSTKGRANFFLLDELEQHKRQTPLIFTFARPALEAVEFNENYRGLANFLLGDVYIVEDESHIPDEISDNVVFLQKDGRILRKKYIQGGGSLGLFEGKRLGRAKNLQSLEKEVAALSKQLAEQKVDMNHLQMQFDSLKKINYSQELDPLNRQFIEKQRDLELLSTREKEHREFLQRVGQRTDTLQNEITVIRQNLKDIEPEIQQAQVMLNRLLNDLGDARGKYQEFLSEYAALTTQHNQANIQLIHLTNSFQNLQRDIERKEQLIQGYDSNTQKMRGELEQVKLDIDTLVQTNLNDDSDILEMHEKKKALEEIVDRGEQKLAETKGFIRQMEEAVEVERRKRETLLSRQTALKEKNTEIKLQLTSLRERMLVEFQVNIDQLSKVLLEGETPNVSELEEKMMKIRNQMQSYGEINPMALEAYNEMKERYDFIQKQCDDLKEAKKSLLNTIAEIDETARVKFMDTFELVRKHFMEVFRSLFSADDTCDLVLLNPDMPLESEIEIIARPKGKRPLSISQLSGGEKTLTAVALLFSIYLIKPAPFCVFDEVDAPLDDANIDKFNNIIRDFSKDSQFIIVTHNKRTMASTRVMYGVTMEDTGVSRMLPVSLEALNLN